MRVMAVPDEGFGPSPQVLERADLVLGLLEEMSIERLTTLG